VNAEARDLWQRAVRTLNTARTLTQTDPDSAVSRAYYAAFHAVAAVFAAEGRSFRKHSAIEAAVHRDLVRTGRCPDGVGIAYSKLAKMRSTADYGSPQHIAPKEAMDAVNNAEIILNALARLLPEDFASDH
jgi:uncharacterized protein (UPF0332 family)